METTTFKSVIRSAGTVGGPCADDCDHNDCYQMRRDADAICPQCRDVIGYDRSFFFQDDYYLHALCLVEAAL